MDGEKHACKCSKKNRIILIALFINIIASISMLIVVLYLIFAILLPIKSQLSEFPNGRPQHNKVAKNKIPSNVFKKLGVPYEEAIKSEKPMAILFYADWCPYCIKFAPIYKKVAKNKKLNKSYNFVFVNSEKEESVKLMEKYDVHTFPTVLLLNQKTNKKMFVPNEFMFIDNAKDILKGLFEEFVEK